MLAGHDGRGGTSLGRPRQTEQLAGVRQDGEHVRIFDDVCRWLAAAVLLSRLMVKLAVSTLLSRSVELCPFHRRGWFPTSKPDA